MELLSEFVYITTSIEGKPIPDYLLGSIYTIQRQGVTYYAVNTFYKYFWELKAIFEIQMSPASLKGWQDPDVVVAAINDETGVSVRWVDGTVTLIRKVDGTIATEQL